MKYTLANGSRTELIWKDLQVDRFLEISWVGNTTLILSTFESALTLSLKQRQHFPETARLAGGTIPDLPLATALALAFIAHSHQLPSRTQVGILGKLAVEIEARVDFDASVPQLSASQVTEAVRQACAARTEAVSPPAGVWNAARFLIGLGKALWELRGAEAAWWGSVPAYGDADDPFATRAQLSVLASLLLSEEQRKGIPYPLGNPPTTDSWLEWIVLAAGPNKPSPLVRAPSRGGEAYNLIRSEEVPDELQLSPRHAHQLHQLAVQLVRSALRPTPRYLGRVVRVEIPSDLLPRLAQWHIDSILVQIEHGGLYVSLFDQKKLGAASAWWSIDLPSDPNLLRVPATFPASLMILLSAVLAALWHDLCAESIVLPPPDELQGDAPSSQPTPLPGTKQGKKKHGKPAQRYISLPPVKRAPQTVQWADAVDREALRHATRGGHGYRPLPTGWEERQERRDFQERQREAALRAQKYLYPPPPLGFTYVKPFVRGASLGEISEEEGAQPLPKVRSRGLFSLILGLQESVMSQGEDADEQEEHEEGAHELEV